MTAKISDEALGRLRAAQATLQYNAEVQKIIAARDEVIARYSPFFQIGAIETLPEEVLRSFLYFENNRHWTGLNRQVNRICADMGATRAALSALVDESQPIVTRMAPATAIKGMGKGIITAILHVAYPDRYGVWNNTSVEGLIATDLIPDLARGSSFGERYAAINEVLNALALALEVDLWTLDALWWNLGSVGEVEADDDAGPKDPSPLGGSTGKRAFALERHLHEYLLDNWQGLSLAADWEIYSPDGDPGTGSEVITPIGRIDLLARHRNQPRWLVIELKRHASSDQVVGQVLRYVGWIKAHLAEPGETVEGLIVAREGDEKLHYAISAAPNLSFMSYEVQFHLKPGPSFADFAKP